MAPRAAAIDAAQAHPPAWKSVVRRVLAVAAAGAAIYLVLPSLIAVLGAWPRLAALNPVWFTVAIAAELISFTCNFGLQRLALQARGWFAVVTAGLAGNAVTDTLPGGDAAGAAVQFRMLTTAGFDTDTAVGGHTAFSLLGVGGLLALPLFALPAILGGAAASPGLVHTALLGLAGFALYAIFGVVLLRSERPLAALGRAAQVAEPPHPRPPPGDRPGYPAARGTRHGQDRPRGEMAAGGPADHRPPRLRLWLPDGGLDVQITLPATPTGHSPTPRQPHTTAPQTWQPDHRIPPVAGQGRPVADGSGLS